MKPERLLLPVLLAAYLAGCSSVGTRPPVADAGAPKKGGYYLDDGPGDNPPADLAAIPDAVPKWEPLHRHANKPYTALGRQYVPQTTEEPYKARGLASWYGRRYHGKATSSGELYDMYGMTAAHPTLPIPSYVRVTNLKNGRSVVLRVNDRGPFKDDRLIDVTYTAAFKLDILRGVTLVEVERVFAEDAPAKGVQIARVEQPVVEPTPLLEPTPLAEAKPLAAVPAAEAAKAAAPGRYLQVGAFGNPTAADDLAARIVRKLGLGVRRVQAGSLHKVQIGPFPSAEALDQASRTIQEAFGIRPLKIELGG
ncbi:rare lipoprotein A [Sulfuritortus calidifontis]|uniref:Endolytic peptidoglycan transglycosylase RlpA n=1 Tax=Sulfuritortus calidifontis TaxID=1914471 RepID=A0A4V2UQQ4_9PROT|nr:septal ring lytic transglycosylase RlpA family protein [Sulfuritortus calidifontis]TCS72115.1 rare lipoprotein A [Sulfuritortus calidifontis]